MKYGTILATYSSLFAVCATSSAQALGEFRLESRTTHRTTKERIDEYPYPGSGSGAIHILVTRTYYNYCQGSLSLNGISGSNSWSDPFGLIYDQTVGPITLIDETISLKKGFYIRVTEKATRSVYQSDNFLAAKETLTGEQYLPYFSLVLGWYAAWVPVTFDREEVKYTDASASFRIEPVGQIGGGDPVL